MAKKKESKIPAEDRQPADNNWEIEEKDQESEVERGVLSADESGSAPDGEKQPEIMTDAVMIHPRAFQMIGKIEEEYSIDLLPMISALIKIADKKVDPQFFHGHMVAHWAFADDHVTYIFSDGRKVRINL